MTNNLDDPYDADDYEDDKDDIDDIIGDSDKIDDYEKTLFTDKEAINEVCSFKSTTHCSAAIASFITGIICNYAYNKKYGEKTRPIPFETEFEFPLFNLTIL